MIVYYLVTALHVIVCIILILVVLLQSGKGADLAGAFGGGATQTAFGSRGPASFLSKLTTGAAVIFMLTSISLSLIGERREVKSILETGARSSAPAPQKTPSKQLDIQVPTPEQIKKIQQEVEAKQKQSAGGQASQPAGGKEATQETKPPSSPKP
jgi:preprotein translocase subunit SecG